MDFTLVQISLYIHLTSLQLKNSPVPCTKPKSKQRRHWRKPRKGILFKPIQFGKTLHLKLDNWWSSLVKKTCQLSDQLRSWTIVFWDLSRLSRRSILSHINLISHLKWRFTTLFTSHSLNLGTQTLSHLDNFLLHLLLKSSMKKNTSKFKRSLIQGLSETNSNS